MPKYSARKDKNQTEIVAYLREQGATVEIVSAVGKGFPDIAIGYYDQDVLAEIKFGKNVYTDKQKKWRQTWKGSKATIRSKEDCDKILGRMRDAGAYLRAKSIKYWFNKGVE